MKQKDFYNKVCRSYHKKVTVRFIDGIIIKGYLILDYDLDEFSGATLEARIVGNKSEFPSSIFVAVQARNVQKIIIQKPKAKKCS